jgi:hypothetical protein
MTKCIAVGIAAASVFAVGEAAAQQQQDVLITSPAAGIVHRREAHMVGRGAGGSHAATFEFVSSEAGMEGKTVKGAPYSAEAVTESTQVLSDGNRISRKSSSSVYRDSEGRTRKEISLGAIGPWATAAEPVKLVMIHDPVAGVSYTLDEKSKTARKVTGRGMMFSYAGSAGPHGPAVAGVRVPAPPSGGPETFEMESGVGPHITRLRNPEGTNPNAKTESLGKRNIEGVVAEGTRTTLTIPAGEIGNERALEIVTERWYSPELQTMVLTRYLNPMTGENVYKLTNLRRGEPLKSLFEVPADYTVKSQELLPMRMMRKIDDARNAKEVNQ